MNDSFLSEFLLYGAWCFCKLEVMDELFLFRSILLCFSRETEKNTEGVILDRRSDVNDRWGATFNVQ